jgi:accessory gene regulator protein AgrB
LSAKRDKKYRKKAVLIYLLTMKISMIINQRCLFVSNLL